jgi:hypothetical protein
VFEPSKIRTLLNFESIFSNKIVVGPTVPDTKLLLEVGSKPKLEPALLQLVPMKIVSRLGQQ